MQHGLTGIQYRGMDPLQELKAFSQEQRLLLVLDSCDHIIVAATYLAEKLYGETEHVHILVTSREPLRTEGEHVHEESIIPCEVLHKNVFTQPQSRMCKNVKEGF